MDSKQDLEELFLTEAIFGGDGDEGKEGEGDESESEGSEGSEGEDEKSKEESDPLAGKDGEGDTFDLAYVKKLRSEAAKYRTSAKSSQEKLDKIEREQMSDLEKAEADSKEDRSARKVAEKALAHERLTNFVIRLADTFHDPQDAVDAIDLESITMTTDGTPDPESVKVLLDAIAKDKPYLLKSGKRGSGDGGPRGNPDSELTDADKVKAEKKRLTDAGMVEIPI